MTPGRRRRALGRAVLIAAIAVIVTTAGVPTVTSASGLQPSAVEPGPADPIAEQPSPATAEPEVPASEPPSTEPAVSDPVAPTPSAPATETPPATGSTPSSSPADPTPAPASPLPAVSPLSPVLGTPTVADGDTPVWPGLTTSAPTGVVTGSALATPRADFALVYPTNPWRYTAEAGTRYLDERNDGWTVRRHLGIDTQGGVRQPILAVADGVVVDGTWGTTALDRHGFGNQIQIAHAGGFATRYAHLAEAPLVGLGESVTRGQVIGYMGGSSRGDLQAYARHLHFEVTSNGQNIDPIAFLTGAGVAAPSDGADGSAPAAVAAAGATTTLHEVRLSETAEPVSIDTGTPLHSTVFTAVAMGAGSAEIMASEGGRLLRIAVVDGAWVSTDTGLALDATSIAGANTGRGAPELLAVEGGRLYHILREDAGWTKTWTGHVFSGTVSAVALPGGRLDAMLQQAGYLYHLRPADGGRWDIVDTGLHADAPADAVYVGGSAPEAMAVVDGEVERILLGDLTWEAISTGLPGSSAVSAAYEGGGWPIALSAEGGVVAVTRVADGVWSRFLYDIAVTGPMDATVVRGRTVAYWVG